MEILISANMIEYRRLSEFGAFIVRVKLDCGEPQISAYTERLDLITSQYRIDPAFLSLPEIRTYLSDAEQRIFQRRQAARAALSSESPSAKQASPESPKVGN